VRALDLFAGAGGAFLGLHQAGLDHVACIEWDVDACRTLQDATGGALLPAHEAVGRRMPGLVRCMDVRRLEPPAAEVWWSSPPCQAWSTAGAKLGAQDERNGWPWVWEAYDRAAVKPRWLFVENVAGMTHHSKAGHGDPLTCAGCYLAEVVLPELRARFPYVVSKVLDAADYGVPQHRRRLFIVASVEPYTWPEPTHGDGRHPWQTMGDALGLAGTIDTGLRGSARSTDRPSSVIRNGKGTGPRFIGAWVLHHGRNTEAHPTQERPTPSTEPAPAINGKGNQLLERPADVRRLTVAECATLQGFPPRWPWAGTATERYRQVGNAVPPALARALAEQVVS